MSEKFVSALAEHLSPEYPNISITENGAIGYKTTGKNLVDLNFALSSMRNMSELDIWRQFILAYNENPTLALLWLFFARDVREGCGERRTFRVIFERFSYENPEVAIRLIPLIPFYGRWDDVIDIHFSSAPCKVRDAALDMITKQIQSDILCFNTNQPISLLCKWMPSLYTSSKETRRRAEVLRSALGWAPKQYRRNLAGLRKRINVVEQDMSANKWDEIDYKSVPSRASMNYRDAFVRHDGDRYFQYLEDVKSGKSKINSGVLFPYDIVHAYPWNSVDYTLEEQWKALPNKVPDNQSTLVVVDGSGSMGSTVGNTNVTCHDVARSLAIYFAEKIKGPFNNTFITFSANPRMIHFDDDLTLCAKLDILRHYDECSNTDIERTFDLLLDAAVRHHMKQEDLPANILILSDMEFDMATWRGGWYWGVEDPKKTGPVDQALFDEIRYRWEKAGYKLPRLVFWNICSRTGTIPLTTNSLGVALVSGFSPNIADMVMSAELDPYKCLLSKLYSSRYLPVAKAIQLEE